MANPAEAAARNAGNPYDEDQRPDIIMIEQWIDHSGVHWSEDSVKIAKEDIRSLITEIHRLRSLAGIVE